MLISIIFPVYNEKDNLNELYERVTEVVDAIKDYRFELIFVDDCSQDESSDILKDLHLKDKRVKVFRFARNSGSHAAVACGLHHCQGDAVSVLAADLQDPPSIMTKLIEEWQKGVNLVWAVRLEREGERASTNFFSKVYYAIMNRFTNVKMPPKGADVFLADRAVIDAFKKVPEKNSSLFMTLAWLGFKQSSVGYVKEARHQGESKWTLTKKIKLAVDSLLSFSDIPIRYMSIVGFFIAILGFLYALVVFGAFLMGTPVEGWASLMVVILVIGGVQMMMLGVLGEYLWRTYDESRRRPMYVLEYVLENNTITEAVSR